MDRDDNSYISKICRLVRFFSPTDLMHFVFVKRRTWQQLKTVLIFSSPPTQNPAQAYHFALNWITCSYWQISCMLESMLTDSKHLVFTEASRLWENVAELLLKLFSRFVMVCSTFHCVLMKKSQGKKLLQNLFSLLLMERINTWEVMLFAKKKKYLTDHSFIHSFTR